jgi:uncharacterized Tic20 family protein
MTGWSVPLGDYMADKDNLLAILAHALGIVFGWLPPLIIWLVKKDDSEFVSRHARHALGFQLTISIALIVSFGLMFVLIGFVTIIAAYVLNILFGILASLAASKGEEYNYPKWAMIPFPFVKD